MAFQAKVIAITGGGQGIGLSTAKILASKGASVSIADVNPTTLAAVEKEFEAQGWPIHTAAIDIRKVQDVDGWIAGAVQKFGRLDGAVNAAGTIGKLLGQKPVGEQDENDWNFVMDVNITGMMHCLRAELQHIVDGGSIVNLSSEKGSQGGPGFAAYCASKHAVIGLSKCAAHDYGKRQIRVNIVSPGGTLTPMMTAVVGDTPPPSHTVLGKHGQPEEVANMIVWLLGPESTHSTGSIFRVDGGEFV